MMAGVNCSDKTFIPSIMENYLGDLKVERDMQAHTHTQKSL
jgi:hypothetical protein